MSILEILEAHHEWDVDIDYDGSQDAVTCPCGWRELLGLHAGAQHRAHVAQVLEQHEREAKAEALEEAYYYGLGRTGHSLHRWLRDRATQLKEDR